MYYALHVVAADIFANQEGMAKMSTLPPVNCWQLKHWLPLPAGNIMPCDISFVINSFNLHHYHHHQQQQQQQQILTM